MKDSAKLQREILVQKKMNIEKNILNIQEKVRGLQVALLREQKALNKVNKTLDSFGKPKKPKENEVQNLNSSGGILKSTSFTEKSV